jgi:cellulose synthase/poly-beta-1,6-N-acetylglucosamine synthase-like glycosyltransferase
MIRHLIFTYFGVFGKPMQMQFTEIEGVYTPKVTVLIPAHNEEAVIGTILDRMTQFTYPKNKLEVIVVDDSSTDKTGEIADKFCHEYEFIKVIHRKNGGGRGKPAALNEGFKSTNGEIIVNFDADYYPQLDIIEKLVAPFIDPEVGMVQGRVTVDNEEDSIVSKLVTLERIGGYRIDQMARDDLVLVPQYGGTVGGIRRSFLEKIGGWDPHMLADDTDLTIRCILEGHKVRYSNTAESYEEAVKTWKAYWNQRYRWAKGHMQCFAKYLGDILKSKRIDLSKKTELILLLSIYFLPILALVGWVSGMASYFMRESSLPYGLDLTYIIPLFSYSTVGNFAPFFEIGMAVYLDERKNLQLIIPALTFTFVLMVFCCTKALFDLAFTRNGTHAWNHTVHNGNGNHNGNHSGNGYHNGRNGNGYHYGTHNGNGNSKSKINGG